MKFIEIFHNTCWCSKWAHCALLKNNILIFKSKWFNLVVFPANGHAVHYSDDALSLSESISQQHFSPEVSFELWFGIGTLSLSKLVNHFRFSWICQWCIFWHFILRLRMQCKEFSSLPSISETTIRITRWYTTLPETYQRQRGLTSVCYSSIYILCI